MKKLSRLLAFFLAALVFFLLLLSGIFSRDVFSLGLVGCGIEAKAFLKSRYAAAYH